MEPIPEGEDKKPNIVHYKVNIFGDKGVGKSSLISHIENYEKDDYTIDQNKKEDNQEISELNDFIVEPIKRVSVPINEDTTIHFSFYETNLNINDINDSIISNLDTLLVQTDCIILMWNNDANSFKNILNLINILNDRIKIK